MENKYICPRCGKQMKLNNDSNILSCKGFFCGQEISLAEYLLSPHPREDPADGSHALPAAYDTRFVFGRYNALCKNGTSRRHRIHPCLHKPKAHGDELLSLPSTQAHPQRSHRSMCWTIWAGQS